MLPLDKDGEPLMNAVLYGVDTRAHNEIEILNSSIGEEKIMKFKISRIQGANGILPLPRLEVKFQGGEKKLDLRTLLDFPIGN